MIGAVLDHAGRINDTAREQDRIANGERVIGALVSQVDLERSGGATFSGDEKDALFMSWCPHPCIDVAHGHPTAEGGLLHDPQRAAAHGAA